jgi:hypothetical protein
MFFGENRVGSRSLVNKFQNPHANADILSFLGSKDKEGYLRERATWCEKAYLILGS